MNALGVILLWTFLQGLALLIPAAFVYFVARRLGPAPAATVAFAGVVLPLALVILAFAPWPLWIRFAPDGPAHAVRAQQTQYDLLHDSVKSVRRTGPEKSSGTRSKSDIADSTKPREGVLSAFAALAERVGQRVQSAASAEGHWTWLGWSALVAIVGASFNLLYLICALLELRKLRLTSASVEDEDLLETLDIVRAELSVVAHIELRELPDVELAAVMGWRRPVILLAPGWRGWTEEQRLAVLAHEVAHVGRRDFAIWACARLALALQFFQPLARWMISRLEIQQELSADALACSVAGVGGQQSYRAVLFGLVDQVAARRVPCVARAFLPSRGNLAVRLETLKYVSLPTTLPSVPARFAVVAFLAIAGSTVAGVRSPFNVDRVAPDIQQTHDDGLFGEFPVDDGSPHDDAPQQIAIFQSNPPANVAVVAGSPSRDGHPNSDVPQGGHEYRLAPNGTLLIHGLLEGDVDRDAFRLRLEQPGPVHVTVIPAIVGSKADLRTSWSVPERSESNSDRDFGSGRGGRMFVKIPHVSAEPDNWVNIDLTSALDDNGRKPLGDYLLFVRQPRLDADIDPETLGPAASPILLDRRGNGSVAAHPKTGKHGPRLDYPGDVDVFAVNVPRAGRYTIGVDLVDGTESGAVVSARFEVYDSIGQFAKRADQPGSTGRIQITVEAKPGDVYYLKVSAADGKAVGAYIVQVTGPGGQ